jgi:hypothetical protein
MSNVKSSTKQINPDDLIQLYRQRCVDVLEEIHYYNMADHVKDTMVAAMYEATQLGEAKSIMGKERLQCLYDIYLFMDDIATVISLKENAEQIKATS